MPPKVGAAAVTKATISSTSVVSMQSGKASTFANSLNSSALPSITGIAASGPDVAEPEHRRAVGDDGDRVALDGQRPRALRLGGDRAADAGDPRRVGHREVVARLDRDGPVDLDLAAEVHQEGAVGDALDADVGDGADRLDHALAVLGVDAGDGDVADLGPALDAHEVDRPEDRARLADRDRHLPERARALREARADRDAVGRGRRRDAHQETAARAARLGM